MDEIFINLRETGQISILKQSGQEEPTYSHIIVKFKNSKDNEKILKDSIGKNKLLQ